MYEYLKNKQSFLQSEEWRKFQEAVGRKTFQITNSPSPLAHLPNTGEGDFGFHANIIEHKLPIVGKYFYVPRGPIISEQETVNKEQFNKLFDLAKKENTGWIRFDAENKEVLEMIKNSIGSHLTLTLSSDRRGGYKVVKAPHDMQPKEIFVIDIIKPEEELLKEMKSKTRYNIKLSQKKGVAVINEQGTRNNKYIEDFLRLNRIMAKRQGIKTHDDEYYRKMFETIPENILKLYVAEYENTVIAVNIVIFYGDTVTYLHGASNDEYKNVMAPYLLQWQTILDAKKMSFSKYDLGGVKIVEQSDLTPTLSLTRRGSKGEVSSWAGITRFKLGFSPHTSPIEYPGSYDIIISPVKYWMYRILQFVKNFVV